ncbi:PAK-related kinase Nak1 [Taphrina deformans PYCC 5710]|uniref:non-specific serine/threonine protein kinase n=1 Tax=Taphrina deformans (strain PYCC 5710 / ATCC 11124 / CBS 356.35 / IMI 108563 / JCM 9778 / NBRC 8474) TaxID=1097556 RepID=R4X9U8_TAPDE|nr:PAK-related kinase Nak1 [Taphrina deformans PYCC 5710]|eukprot:CCG81014.1 PAK-related kinase Nak1 [Taphrina deformans PYCC 5710]
MNRMHNHISAPYTRHEVIGRGSYGVVYKGIHNSTKSAVAIKVLNLDTAEDEVADIQKEIVLLQSLKAGDAQNVVRYHGSFLNGTRLWIIMDYCEGGSIRTLMKSGRIEEKYIAIIVREVLAALNYIHRADIIHRDVKAANILVTNDGRVQLCDFGVAAQLAANHFKRNTFVGTPYWMAPEVISDGLSYNYKADIWSLGITIYEIATGNPPYADQEPMRAIFLIPRSTAPRLEGATFSMPMREFVAVCLSERAEDRPAATELLRTRWMKQISKVQTSLLRDLVVRYEGWRKSGGVRKSLAMGGDMDVDEEFGGQFGLDECSDTTPNGWDFGTLRNTAPSTISHPTWEQSADATEDLLRTIRPGIVPTQMPPGSSGSARYDHPLMKLFGENKPTLNPASQSMLELPTTRTPLNSEPSTPMGEIVTIEMPALNATSLASVSSLKVY